MPTYLNKEKQHNKFWKYEISGLSVAVSWGRVGAAGQSKTHSFKSSSEMQTFLDKIIYSKTKKGYALSNEKELKQEVQTAQMMGLQYKISKMLFVSQKGNKLTQISGYDSKKYVYVEILNSWKKDITRLLLSKTESFLLSGGVTESNKTITYGHKTSTAGSFVEGVRSVLRRLSEQLVEIIKTVNFAAVGVRKLFDEDGDDDSASQSQEYASSLAMVLDQVDLGGVDRMVVSRFASMGARVLEL